MAKNISLLGADYPDVPAVTLPQTGGGTATFYDVEVTDGDPTLAWSTRSKVGTVNGTDLHVTMPGDPNALTDVSSYFETGVTVNFAYRIGKIVFYSIFISGITSAANTAYTQKVLKDAHLPSYAMISSVFPGSDSLPVVAGNVNTAGNLSIRHGSAALSGAWYTITGILIYN